MLLLSYLWQHLHIKGIYLPKHPLCYHSISHTHRTQGQAVTHAHTHTNSMHWSHISTHTLVGKHGCSILLKHHLTLKNSMRYSFWNSYSVRLQNTYWQSNRRKTLNNNNNNNKLGFKEPSSNPTPLKTLYNGGKKKEKKSDFLKFVCKNDLKTLNIYTFAHHTHIDR